MSAGSGNFNTAHRVLRAQLEIDFADGTRTVINTDSDWTAGTGGLRYADLQNGVVDDARWSRPDGRRRDFPVHSARL